jgi:hypothetical protein
MAESWRRRPSKDYYIPEVCYTHLAILEGNRRGRREKIIKIQLLPYRSLSAESKIAAI